jgi:hypothetical protein
MPPIIQRLAVAARCRGIFAPSVLNRAWALRCRAPAGSCASLVRQTRCVMAGRLPAGLALSHYGKPTFHEET